MDVCRRYTYKLCRVLANPELCELKGLEPISPFNSNLLHSSISCIFVTFFTAGHLFEEFQDVLIVSSVTVV